MRIIDLGLEHIDQILELESHSGPDRPLYIRYDREALEFIFNNSGCSAIGGFEDNKLIGWGAYRTSWSDDNSKDGVYEISSVVVDKNKRGKGIGSSLLDSIIKKIKSSQESIVRIYLTVSPHNSSALHLYLKKGFIIDGFKKDAYGPNSDRVYLSLPEKLITN